MVKAIKHITVHCLDLIWYCLLSANCHTVSWSSAAYWILVVIGCLPFEQKRTPQPFSSVFTGNVAPVSELFESFYFLLHRQPSFIQETSFQWWYSSLIRLIQYSSYKKHILPENITMLRSVQCGVWIGFRQCLLRASELTQTSLSNIIRHIYSRVQCKSKHSAAADPAASGSCQLDIVNKCAVTSTGHIYCQCVLVSSFKALNWLNACCFGWQTKTGGKNMDYEGMGTQ